MNSRVKFVALCCGLLLFSLVGCSDGRPQLVPVSGQVLIDGEPLANASVKVVPADTRAAFGRTDEQGHFTLMTFEEGDGCVTGTHKVAVEAATHPKPQQIAYHAPLKYSEIKSSGLNVTIDGPTEDLKIELTWGDEKGPILVSQGADGE